MRIALIGCIAIAVAFAAGVGLRLSADASDAVGPEGVRSIDGGAAPREVRLLRLEPGILPRATRNPTGAPAGSVESNVAVGPTGPPAPAAPEPEAPEPEAPEPEAPVPSSPADDGGSFDSSGEYEPSEANSFDSEG